MSKLEEDESEQVKKERLEKERLEAERREEDGQKAERHKAAMYEFANWAFSADGLPNLQVVACGDFSTVGHGEASTILLCKSDTTCGYQALTPVQGVYWNLVQDNMDMLAACLFDNRT